MKLQRLKTPKLGKMTRSNSREKDPVEVYCRIRPLELSSYESCCRIEDDTTLVVTSPEFSHAMRNGGTIRESVYHFDRILDEHCSQKAIFDHLALPLVCDLLSGKDALLFTYGVTSSGKTHTITGEPKDPGILPRCMDVIFNSIETVQAKKYVFKPDRMNGFDVQPEVDAILERQNRELLPKLHKRTVGPRSNSLEKLEQERVKETSVLNGIEEDNNFAIFVSYIEIYNNYIYDLLEDNPNDIFAGARTPQSKILREDNCHKMYVNGCTEIEVKSTEDAYAVLFRGQKRRKVAHTALNSESSRSHSVFNIRLVQAPLDDRGEEVIQDKNRICISQLSLVDLAGSERTLRTGNQGDRLREAGNINQSLMALRACLDTLRENQCQQSNKMVPYRDSKLTHLFKNYFDGVGKVRMIVCINPKSQEYDETVQVLKFAEMTQEVQIARPEEVHFDIGLTKGRRHLNQQFKDLACDKDPTKAMDPFLGYALPSYSPILIGDLGDDSHIDRLIQLAEERKACRSNLLAEIQRRHDELRSKLMNLDTLDAKFSSMNATNNVKEQVTDQLRRQIEKLEQENICLKSTAHIARCQQKKLNVELNEKNNKMQEWKQRLQTAEKNHSRVVKNLETKSKFHPPVSRITRNTTAMEPEVVRVPMTAPTPTERLMQNGVTPLSHNRPRFAGSYTAARASRPRARSPPPPLKPKPMMTRRRSKSQGDLWLDHRSRNLVEVDTLMQPRMKKKRSVTQLTEKDIGKANKYALTHQDLDSEGDTATHMFKGDVRTTMGGGSAVVFTDVETLKMKEPPVVKRKSQPQPEDFEGGWTDSEDRCRIAIEGHGNLKKIRTQR